MTPEDSLTLTKDGFMALQRELENLELAIAKGQETETTDARLAEIVRQMDAGQWAMHPDDGCILKNAD